MLCVVSCVLFLRLSPQESPDIDYDKVLQHVANKETTLNKAVGQPVGCLMATFGSNQIRSYIYDFNDPEELK